ncbi:MAG: hypothetical protein OXH92_16520 [Bryobacterales bacterium]|nr:hypothetical protein [Bryobacterales bacterium]
MTNRANEAARTPQTNTVSPRVPHWYCRENHTTIGLLAGCLVSDLPGTLGELEAVVVAAEEVAMLGRKTVLETVARFSSAGVAVCQRLLSPMEYCDGRPKKCNECNSWMELDADWRVSPC